jgi:hypothetical protein
MFSNFKLGLDVNILAIFLALRLFWLLFEKSDDFFKPSGHPDKLKHFETDNDLRFFQQYQS